MKEEIEKLIAIVEQDKRRAAKTLGKALSTHNYASAHTEDTAIGCYEEFLAHLCRLLSQCQETTES